MDEVQRHRLANGLTVLTEEIHHAPVVALQAWVNVGSADEEAIMAGVAHVHEHMLFKGTARRAVGDIAKTIEASGGEINAWTSFDQTVYHMVVASQELETGVDILGDALQFSSFDAAELARETEVILEEIRRAQDTPARRLSWAVFELAYPNHPYGRPVLGSEATVQAMTREQIVHFFKSYYHPGATTLVAVGDFNTAQLLAQVQTHLGSWQGTRPVSKPSRPAVSLQTYPQVRVLAESVKEAHLQLAWHAPSVRHPDTAAMDALAVILGQGEASRLALEVRRRLKLVHDAYAYAYTPQDTGLWLVGAGLPAGQVVDALKALLKEVYRLRKRRVGEDELQRARVQLLSEAAYQRETVQGQARKRGFFEVVGGDWAFEAEYLQALKALQPEDLRQVAQRYLHANPAVVVQVPTAFASDTLHDTVQEVVQQAFETVPQGMCGPTPGRLGVTRVTLESGTVVLVAPEDTPVVALRAVALGGQRWERREQAGLGHLFATLWAQACEGWPAALLAQRVALLGGSIEAFSGRNTVGLRGEFVGDKAQEGLEVFCEALVRPTFESSDLERERAIVMDHIRNRDDHPSSVAFEAFTAHLFPKHSYGLPLLGTEASVASFTLDDMHAYHRDYMASDKLVVAVVGPVEVADVLESLEAHIKPNARACLPAVQAMDARPYALQQVRIHLPRQQAHVVVGGQGTRLDDPQRFVLSVMMTLLAGQSGRLFLDLRDKQSLAYSVSSHTLVGVDPGLVWVYLGTHPDKVEQALAGIYQHFKRLETTYVDSSELDRAKRYLIGSQAMGLQRAGARATLMALNERYGLGYDAHSYEADAIEAVSAEDIRKAARRYLQRENLIEVVVGPQGQSQSQSQS